jgi:xanthine dehydrogenase iron-sulfur cluster and FAD-binding subunit A
LARPGHLVDVNAIPELGGIGYGHDGSSLALGATVRQRQAERSALVQTRAPLMGSALAFIGHAAIRNRGTVGGSIAHADPAAELPAVLTALDGEVVARSIRGTRTIPAGSFTQGFLTTALDADELLTEIHLPAWPKSTGWAFQEFSRRSGDFAVVGVAAVLGLEGRGRVAHAALVFSGVGSTAVRAVEAERLMVGDIPSPELWEAAAEQAAKGLAARRSARLGGIPSAAGPGARAAVAARGVRPREGNVTMTQVVNLTVNGQVREAVAEPRRTLADFVREDLRLTGTHIGCEHGVCGACTVIVDGVAVRSCLMLAVQVAGASVTTIEGVDADGRLHPLQEAFRESFSFQCGFCTPGFVMTALALLQEGAPLDEAGLREALSGNLCRCTGYQSIVDGIQLAAERMSVIGPAQGVGRADPDEVMK